MQANWQLAGQAPLLHRELLIQWRIFGRVADAHNKLAGINFPTVRDHIPIRKRALVESNAYSPRLTRLQRDALESLQFPFRPRHRGGGITNINLRHFRPGAVTRIGNVKAHGNRLASLG